MNLTITTTIIIAAISGLGGAIAGGVVSLIGQFLTRKWQKEDSAHQYKKELYAEIAGIGSHYLGQERLKFVNNLAAKILLVCEPELRKIIVAYVASIETVNNDIKNKKPEEITKIVEDNTDENIQFHKEMLRLMRKELGIQT